MHKDFYITKIVDFLFDRILDVQDLEFSLESDKHKYFAAASPLADRVLSVIGFTHGQPLYFDILVLQANGRQ